MRHGCRQPNPTAPRRQHHQACHAQRQLIAALGSGQRVHLVHHHGGQPGKHRWRVRQRQQHRQALRRRQQHIRRINPLPRAPIGRRIAGARLDGDGKPHLLDRPQQIARDVGGQRLQRTDIQRMDAGAGRFRQAPPASAETPPGSCRRRSARSAARSRRHAPPPAWQADAAAAPTPGRRTTRQKVPAMFWPSEGVLLRLAPRGKPARARHRPNSMPQI